MKLFLFGVLSALLACPVAGFVVAASGFVDVSAVRDGGVLEELLGFASRRSIAHHSEELSVPYQDDVAARAEGLVHYRENCLGCHGAPGVEVSEFAKGLNPPPPPIATIGRTKADRELFWVVSNGIRMTGMPAFSPTHHDDEIWKIVSFVKHLGDLTEAERTALAEFRPAEAGHHGAESPRPPEPADDHGNGP